MSEEQLSALLAKLNEDAGLREKLQGAGDLEAALTLAKEAGFDVSKADWLKYQAKQTLELSDEELDRVAGGQQRGEGTQTNCVVPDCGTWKNPKDDDNRGNACNPMPAYYP